MECLKSCGEPHGDVCARVKALETANEALWKEVNSMKQWVIAGMGGLLMQVVVFIAGAALVFLGKH